MEKFKQKDLLEEMLGEMTGDFPALSRVFVSERDTYLSQSLKACSQPQPPRDDGKTRFQINQVMNLIISRGLITTNSLLFISGLHHTL